MQETAIVPGMPRSIVPGTGGHIVSKFHGLSVFAGRNCLTSRGKLFLLSYWRRMPKVYRGNSNVTILFNRTLSNRTQTERSTKIKPDRAALSARKALLRKLKTGPGLNKLDLRGATEY